MKRRVVLSGCSGGGKSTLLAAMRARGVVCFDEPGRRVVAEGISPVATPLDFALRALELAEAAYHAAPEGVSLYDRSALDALVWFARAGQDLPARWADAWGRLRYDALVYMVPPWPEIYRQDAVRQHDLRAALAEYRALCHRLPEHGYSIRIVPKLPVAARADWLAAELTGR